MATTEQPLKYIWQAGFDDGTKLTQPENDQYSKHIEGAEHNPSSFRDFLDKCETARPVWFGLISNEEEYLVDLITGEFVVNGSPFSVQEQNVEPPKMPKLIYFREVRKEFVDGQEQDAYVNRYFLGWEDKFNSKLKHLISIKA